jgi:hypothetical protein
VEIVESFGPGWEEGAEWRVGPAPLVRIGVVEGDPAYQFDQLTGVVRFSDGTIAVADGGSQEVRLFSGSGVHSRTVGREGGGPGEFTGMSGMGAGQGEEAWVYDFSLRRITWLDASGQVLRMVALGPEPPILHPVGAFSGGFVLRQLWGATAVAQADELGLRRDPIAYVVFDSMGSLMDTLGLFPGRELLITEEDGRGVMGSPLLGRGSSSTVRSSRLVVGSQDRFEIGEYDYGGKLVRLLRLPAVDLTVTAEEVEAYIRDRLEGVPADRRPGRRAELEAMPVPRTRPAYGDLRVDPSGHLWVAAFASFPSLPEHWSVFGPEGQWLGSVEMPPRFYPWDFGEDWLLGTEADDLGVEYVVLYPLIKS